MIYDEGVHVPRSQWDFPRAIQGLEVQAAHLQCQHEEKRDDRFAQESDDSQQIRPSLSKRSSDIIPKGETPNFRDFQSRDGPSILHVADTACVSAHTVPVDTKTEFNKRLFGDAFMQGFARQLKVNNCYDLRSLSCSS